jgi:hypothetical protein
MKRNNTSRYTVMCLAFGWYSKNVSSFLLLLKLDFRKPFLERGKIKRVR